MDDLLGEDEARVVVAALAAVGRRLVQPEEAELAHPLEHPVRERGLLPLLSVGLELLDHEAADRLTQLLVLVGEDEVLALGGEVWLEDVGGCAHAARTVPAGPRKVNSRTSYFLRTRNGRGVGFAAMSYATLRYEVSDAGVATIALDQPDTRNALSNELLSDLAAALQQARDDPAARCVVLTSTHEKVFSSGGNLAGFAADVPLVHKHFGTDLFPSVFRALGELGKPSICAANGHVLAGRARARPRL